MAEPWVSGSHFLSEVPGSPSPFVYTHVPYDWIKHCVNRLASNRSTGGGKRKENIREVGI